MKREAFSIMEYNFEVINNMARNGYEFSHMWSVYVRGCGWDEESYEAELERRIRTDVQA